MAKQAIRRVLFLCTGNYYRSRFAEVLFNSVAAKMGLPWEAASRGLALERGTHNVGPIARSAVAALESLGVRDAAAVTRMPQAVTADDFSRAHRIVALNHTEHLPLLQERFPDWAEKVEFWDIRDAEGALHRIEQEVTGFIARLLGGPRTDTAPIPPAPPPPAPPRKLLTAKVGRETAGRRGKGVTTVFDVSVNESELRELAATLKQKCGTGGTVKEGRIEIQGDQRERIVAELEKLGFKVKRAGG